MIQIDLCQGLQTARVALLKKIDQLIAESSSLGSARVLQLSDYGYKNFLLALKEHGIEAEEVKEYKGLKIEIVPNEIVHNAPMISLSIKLL